MIFQKPPSISRRSIDRAGDVLISDTKDLDRLKEARNILNQWRACHAYPINTFQATLRTKVRGNKFGKDPIVAQRLKRAPTIIAKLREGKSYDIRLLNMQDIAGVRAVLPSVADVRKLEKEYRDTGRFEHVLHPRSRDYINDPKESDGYRSVHLIYQYKNRKHPQWDGLWIELQIRTKLQHSWATAVEAVHTFLDKAIKTRQGQTGDEQWMNFFKLVSSAFAIIEKTPVVRAHQKMSPTQILRAIKKHEKDLKVIDKLKAFNVAMGKIVSIKRGHFHLIILNSKEKTVRVIPFGLDDFDIANEEYSRIENESISDGEVESVLVSANEVIKAYPSFFANTKDFIENLEHVLSGEWIEKSKGPGV